MMVEVKFRLAFGTRKDEAADVHVGYCPLLNLYSQGTTEEEAQDAIVDAAQLFIVTCYGRNTLHRILRDRGMVRAVVPSEARADNRQYIAVQEIDNYPNQFEREVPIDLLASVGQDLAACHP